jgi:hypothetical protein
MIGPKLHLEAIDRAAVGQGHHTGVVDQQWQRLEALPKGCGEAPHAAEIAEIQCHYFGCSAWVCAPYRRHCRLSLLYVADRQDHPRAFAGQCRRCFVADPAVAASDHRDFAALIGNIRNCPLVCCHDDPPYDE